MTERDLTAPRGRPIDDDDYDELPELAAEAARRNPSFVGALEDAQLRQSILTQVIAVRKGLRISQRVVAERMQTTQSAVSDLENGAVDPHLSTLQRYARAVTARLVIGVDLPHDSPWCDAWFYERPRTPMKLNDSEPAAPPRSSVGNWLKATEAVPVAHLDEARMSYRLVR
jgi:transcriptional regulator with XRE-family HTH domain